MVADLHDDLVGRHVDALLGRELEFAPNAVLVHEVLKVLNVRSVIDVSMQNVVGAVTRWRTRASEHASKQGLAAAGAFLELSSVREKAHQPLVRRTNRRTA